MSLTCQPKPTVLQSRDVQGFTESSTTTCTKHAMRETEGSSPHQSDNEPSISVTTSTNETKSSHHDEDINEQQPLLIANTKCPDPDRFLQTPHVVDRSPEPSCQNPDRGGLDDVLQGNVTGRDGTNPNHVRQGPLGQELSGSLDPGKAVANVVHQDICHIKQDRPPETTVLHGNDGGACRAGDRERSEADAADTAAYQTQSQGQSLQRNRDPNARDVRTRAMDGIRTGVCASKPPTGGTDSAAESYVKPGGSHDRDPQSHTPRMNAEHWARGIKLAGDVDADESHIHFTCQSDLQVYFQDLVKQITKEFQVVEQSTPDQRRQRLHLLEVFCSSQSELTKQATNMGYRAKRFGFPEGDLSCPEGRRKLFQIVCQEMPKNVWYSPTCGPWSSWNNLNANRSVESFDQIHQQRVNICIS